MRTTLENPRGEALSPVAPVTIVRAVQAAYVEVHAEDAAQWNIRQGEVVEVQSRRGSTQLPVWIDGRGKPPRGTIFVPFFDETKLINNVTLEAYDPFSKQPDYKKCAVRIRKLSPTAAGVARQ